jgi:hypothetical protein
MKSPGVFGSVRPRPVRPHDQTVAGSLRQPTVNSTHGYWFAAEISSATTAND